MRWGGNKKMENKIEKNMERQEKKKKKKKKKVMRKKELPLPGIKSKSPRELEYGRVDGPVMVLVRGGKKGNGKRNSDLIKDSRLEVKAGRWWPGRLLGEWKARTPNGTQKSRNTATALVLVCPFRGSAKSTNWIDRSAWIVLTVRSVENAGSIR
ncbi:uncharacterized protein BDW43DRAFT_86181 [Aspergillus alliaceus]|uniref:uncharacterized protein n=1 Tax=Petromyces alliaceus TaxID=209559 RepID=UPI0012A6F58B|nr:uncharacterized protein BDW43DRAFT_86181 [Aspergillus alliaceus]KAB8233385.1 hypothetical protein BDW43DRAFT_86181 [Aspergillus alliaceus]